MPLRRSRSVASSRCAVRKAATPAISQNVNPMSSVFRCAFAAIHSMPAATSPARSPATVPNCRRPVRQTSSTVSAPAVAGQSRAVHSSTPNARYAPAVIQYWRGGFSKYLMPFSRGVIQSPVSAISRASSA
jgi:hypothetical protein